MTWPFAIHQPYAQSLLTLFPSHSLSFSPHLFSRLFLLRYFLRSTHPIFPDYIRFCPIFFYFSFYLPHFSRLFDSRRYKRWNKVKHTGRCDKSQKSKVHVYHVFVSVVFSSVQIWKERNSRTFNHYFVVDPTLGWKKRNERKK